MKTQFTITQAGEPTHAQAPNCSPTTQPIAAAAHPLIDCPSLGPTPSNVPSIKYRVVPAFFMISGNLREDEALEQVDAMVSAARRAGDRLPIQGRVLLDEIRKDGFVEVDETQEEVPWSTEDPRVTYPEGRGYGPSVESTPSRAEPPADAPVPTLQESPKAAQVSVAALVELLEELTSTLENVLEHHGDKMPSSDQYNRRMLVERARSFIQAAATTAIYA